MIATLATARTASEALLVAKTLVRCGWCGTDPLYVAYHDEEWGVPVEDDRRLFEFLILEGAQAGLSWLTILRKRDAYRRAFAEFDPREVARFGARQKRRLLNDAGIVRNRLKIDSAIGNARAFLKVQEEFGSFARYQWNFVGGKPVVGRRKALRDIPPRTAISDAISEDLVRRGFRFVGSTIVYAHMQAVGMVNDHLVGCFRRAQILRELPGRSASSREGAPRPRAG
jgi:DNA-3-methyladenine glycosylase I